MSAEIPLFFLLLMPEKISLTKNLSLKSKIIKSFGKGVKSRRKEMIALNGKQIMKIYLNGNFFQKMRKVKKNFIAMKTFFTVLQKTLIVKKLMK